MDSDTIADLKQFISAEMHQQNAGLEKSLEEKITNSIDHAKNEILDALGDTMVAHNTIVDTQLEDHEQRIVRLEHKAA